MDSNIVLTFESAVKINDVPFGVRRHRLTASSDDHETGDTQSGRFKRQKAGRRQLEGELEFYQKFSFDIIDPPFNIVEDGECDLKIYEQGLDGQFHWAPHFVLQRKEFSGDINSPISGVISGKSDGPYYRPGESVGDYPNEEANFDQG